MKILFYISSLGGGGAQRVLWTMANNLSTRFGHNVFVATDLSSDIAYQFDEKVQVVDLDKNIRVKHGIIHFFSLLLSIRRAYNKISPELVISFQRGMNVMVLLTLLLTKAKIICSEHSYFFRKYGIVEDSLMHLLYWKANAITVLTRHDLKVCNNLGKKNVVYMPNPLQSIDLADCVRKTQIIAVGALDRWKIKGFDLLIKAWGKICYNHPEWKLVIAGKGSRDSMEYLKYLVESNSCRNVVFLGFKKDIHALMQESAIFVLSSRFEGLPMALLEAMQAGCCCVSFNCETGPNEIIQNEVNGLLVPAQNIDKLAEALDDVISNQKLRESLSSKARGAVLDKYSEDYVMTRWRNLFSKINL